MQSNLQMAPKVSKSPSKPDIPFGSECTQIENQTGNIICEQYSNVNIKFYNKEVWIFEQKL